LLESSCLGWAVVTVVVGFVFGWWDVSYRFEDPAVVLAGPDAWEGPDAGGLRGFTAVKAMAWFEFPTDVTRYRF